MKVPKLTFSAKRQLGFTLLEVLVAFAIMAMSVGLLYRMAGDSANNTLILMQQQKAIWLAESILNGRDSVAPDGWNEDGESGKFKWQLRSQLYKPQEKDDHSVKLHQIELKMSWPGKFRLVSMEWVTLLPERTQRLDGAGL